MSADDTAAPRGVLMVAFHFPPFAGSSGVQRTLRFCQYLPENGYAPTVLTVRAGIHGKDLHIDDSALPREARVVRAFALDAARHLAIAGRYFRATALPDRWVSWLLGAVPAGLAAIRRERLRLIWSTYPIASAHLVGWALHRLTGLPWVVDFRDPMIEIIRETGETIPRDPTLLAARQWVEVRVARHAARVVFCTAGARAMFLERYPGFDPARCVVIPNGYDENSFAEIERAGLAPRMPGSPLRLLHSGVLYYSWDRDPTAFLDAVASLRADGALPPEGLEILFRASGSEDIYRRLIAERGLDDVVKLPGAVPYQDALREMMEVDGLLLFQGKSSNPAIPAKLYEYIRARRPIFALVDTAGETSKLLTSLGFGAQVPLDNAAAISAGLRDWLSRLRSSAADTLDADTIRAYSRRAQTATLAALFEDVLRLG